MAPRRCQYINCTNTETTHTLFGFPISDKNRLRIWINNSGNINLTTLTHDELKYRRLCEVHFDQCYKSHNDQRKRLVGTAIPRHHHCEDDSIDVISSVPVVPEQVTESAVTPEVLPRKLKVLTPKKVYGKRVSQVLEVQEAGSSSVSSQFGHEMNMPSPQKIRRGIPCTEEKCIETRRRLKATNIILKNKKVQVKRLKRRLLKDNLVQRHKFPSKSSKLIATMQLRRNKQKWTKDEKRFSLSVFYKSPATYNFLRDQGVVLPAVSSIKRWLSESDCLPGVGKDTFQQIACKFENASNQEKACVLTFDEMSTMTCIEYNKKLDFIEGFEDLGRGERTPILANHALVFLARGIFSNWKLPVCYFLSNSNVKSEKLQTLIRVVINKLFEAGLLPKATVCDQVRTNQSALKALGASKEHPYFFVNQRKLFALFDVPHCIKNLRNNWLTNNYTYENKEVSFKDIISTYDIDKNNKSRALVKITPKHLSPNSFQKMKVKLATQIFSHSVAAAVNTAVKTKELLSPTAPDTAEFILIVNNLFDSLNSKMKYDKNPHKCGLADGNAAMAALMKGLAVLKDLKKINRSGNKLKLTIPDCIDGLQQSCNAVIQMYYEESTEGIKYILTNRLNQDVLENLFSIYRLKGGNNKNPSARLLRSVFRSYLTEMLVKLPGTQNCENSINATCDLPSVQLKSPTVDPEPEITQPSAISLTDESNLEKGSPQVVTHCHSTNLVKSSSSGTELNLEQCSVTYFAGWLAKTCQDKFNCPRCYQTMTKNLDLTDRKQLLIIEKSYGDGQSTKLKCPDDDFCGIIDKCLTYYHEQFDLIKHKLNLKKNILNYLLCRLEIDHADTFNIYCREHLSYVLEKMIITKINYYCKSQKRNLIQNQQKIRLLQNK